MTVYTEGPFTYPLLFLHCQQWAVLFTSNDKLLLDLNYLIDISLICVNLKVTVYTELLIDLLAYYSDTIEKEPWRSYLMTNY